MWQGQGQALGSVLFEHRSATLLFFFMFRGLGKTSSLSELSWTLKKGHP